MMEMEANWIFFEFDEAATGPHLKSILLLGKQHHILPTCLYLFIHLLIFYFYYLFLFIILYPHAPKFYFRKFSLKWFSKFRFFK